MFKQLGRVLVAGRFRGGWHLRLAELHVVEPFQVEGQTALWTVERACATHDDLLEIRKLSAIQRVCKGCEGLKIDPSEIVVRKTLGVRPTFVGIECRIAVVDVNRGPNECVLSRFTDPD